MTIFLSIVSAIIAALLTHHLTLDRIRKSELSKYQNETYSDFIAAVSRLAVSRRLGDTQNEYLDLVSLNDAKSRILTNGHPDVVEALVEFWMQGATLEKEGEILAFKRLLLKMRLNLGYKNHDVAGVDISSAIFRMEPSDYSFRKGKEANKKV